VKPSPETIQPTLPQLFDQAVSLHLAGSAGEAQVLYESYLGQCVSLPVVRTNLAGIYLDQGRFDEAEALLQLAIAEAPHYSEALSNRGYLSVLRGQPERALPDLEAALEGSPALTAALVNLVPIYRQQGRAADALPLLERALQQAPANVEIHAIKARLLQTLHGNDRALASLDELLPCLQGQELIALQRARAQLLLAEACDLPACLEALDQVVRHAQPPLLEDLINRGEVLRRLGRLDEALAWTNQHLLERGEPAGLINLKACILQDRGEFDDALTLFQMASAADPFNPLFHANHGFLLSIRGAYLKALEVYRQGLAISPNFSSLHHGAAETCFHLGKPFLAHDHFLKALAASPDNLTIWDNFLYFLSFVNAFSPQLLRSHHQQYVQAALLPRVGAAEASFLHHWTEPEERPLRIGILSAEIGSHCVSYFLLSLIQGATSSQAEFFLFPTKDRSAEPRWQRFRELSRHFECIEQLSDRDACERIRSFNLDVVLETSQHMTANRLVLMARRLAPIQGHYIGMHGSTAVPAIDLFLGDRWVTEDSFAPQFSERLLRLPRTWVCYSPPEQGLPEIRSSDPAAPLRLGSFNNVSKISRTCLRVWAQLLLALPEATLLIKDSLRSGELDQQRNLIGYLQRRGVDPKRIRVLTRTDSWEDHMDLYNELDIALDTLPLTSGTTAFDALLMGVPLIAYSSAWIGGRLSASIVNGFGQPDWIAESPQEYLSVVAALASDLPALRAGRQQRREQFLASELCDQQSLATAVVEALRQTYRKAMPA